MICPNEVEVVVGETDEIVLVETEEMIDSVVSLASKLLDLRRAVLFEIKELAAGSKTIDDKIAVEVLEVETETEVVEYEELFGS